MPTVTLSYRQKNPVPVDVSPEHLDRFLSYLRPGIEYAYEHSGKVTDGDDDSTPAAPRVKKSTEKQEAKTKTPGVCRGAALTTNWEHGTPGRGRANGFCKACVANMPTDTRQKIFADAQNGKSEQQAAE